MIWESKSESIAFEKAVISTAEKCNSLVELFESFQEWKRIESLEDWIQLVDSPKDYFDKILIASLDLKVTGKQPNPEILAQLYGVDRSSFLNLTAGMPVNETCEPCKKLKIHKGSTAISLSSYQQFESFMIFNSGHFVLNIETVKVKKETFKIFADTEAKIKVVTFWESLCDILNQYHDKYHINNEDKRIFCKALKLQQSEGYEGKFVVNNQLVSLEIQNMK